MFPTFISILDIQSWWEVPSIAHFCSLFRTAFNLLDFDIEDLEEALLTDGTEEPSWLQELIVRLLSGCLPNNEISTFNYQMFLRRLFRQKCEENDQFNPFNTDTDFQLLPLKTKVDILYALCDFRLDAEDVLDLLKNLEADSLRVEPLGYDGNDSAYWYFYGTRLYREDFETKDDKKGSVWQVICFSEYDWFHLTEKFEKSKSKGEKQLYHTLCENFLPELPRLFKEKERLARKRLLENQPRRTSDRLRKSEFDVVDVAKEAYKIDEKKEKEEKKRELESKRRDAYERRNKLKDALDSDHSDKSTRSDEMAPDKIKTKTRGRPRKSAKATDDSGNAKGSKKNHTQQSTKSEVKLVGRQTNNSLAAAAGQILIDSFSGQQKKKLKSTHLYRQTYEDLQTGMHKILDNIKDHEDAWPFTDPVEEEYAPNYYIVIRKPMYLQKMEEKLDSGYYKSFKKFREDFQLIINNCRLYNGIDNEYTEMANNLAKDFEVAAEKYLDQSTSSEDDSGTDHSSPPRKSQKNSSNLIESSSKSNQKKKPSLTASTNKKQHKDDYDDEEDCDTLSDEESDDANAKIYSKKHDKNHKGREKNFSKENKIDKHKLLETKNNNKHRKRSESINKVEALSQKSYEKCLAASTKEKKEKKSIEIDSSSRKKIVELDSSSKKTHSKHHMENETFTAKKNISPSKHDLLKEAKSRIKHNSHSSDYISSKKSHSKREFENDVVHKPKKPNVNYELESHSVKKSFAKQSPDDTLSRKTHSLKYKFEEAKERDRFKKSSKYDNQKVVEEVLKLKDKENLYDVFDQLKYSKTIREERSPRIDHSQPKDKHNKLRETIEKLKAKSEFVLNEGEFEVSVKKEQKRHDKETKHKQMKHFKTDYNFLDQPISENDKPTKSSIAKTVELEALSLATEQTLKDINKWLDDTPKAAEFSSASNSPSYVHLESLDAAKTESDLKKLQAKKDGVKDVKKRPAVKSGLEKIVKKRDIQRTIDRLQPGKSKGNLITSVPSATKTQDETFPMPPIIKLKDTKNSLIVKTDDNAPKLSLGTVLDSFGKHKFADDQNQESTPGSPSKPFDTPFKSLLTSETEENRTSESTDKPESATEAATDGANPTPNLSAWFKAFGAPKVQTVTVQKKTETKSEAKSVSENVHEDPKTEQTKEEVLKVPLAHSSPNCDSPAPSQPGRQRRISTGSSMSERSSFSQDMDSPRVGIDERLGAYPAPYPSPMHRSPSGVSPVMASPQPDMSPRAYPPINGQMRVGFYQDTVSNKGSPEKMVCSPRDAPRSPYVQYPEPVYNNKEVPYQYPNQLYPNAGVGQHGKEATISRDPVYENNRPPRTHSSNVDLNESSPHMEIVEQPSPSPQSSVGMLEPEQIIKPIEKLPIQIPMVPMKKRICSETELNRIENSVQETLKNTKPVEQSSEKVNPNYQKPFNDDQNNPAHFGKVSHAQALTGPPSSDLGEANRNYNYRETFNDSYPSEFGYQLNIPRSVHHQEMERKIDMSKYTNMGYVNPDVNFARSLQQYTTMNENNYVQSTALQASTTQSTDIRYSMPVGFKGMEVKQNQQLNNYPQNSQAPLENVPNRYHQPGDYKIPDVSMDRVPYNTNLENEQSMGLRANFNNLSHIAERYNEMASSPSYFADKSLTNAHLFNKHVTSASSIPMFTSASIAMASYNQSIQTLASSVCSNRPNSDTHLQTVTADVGSPQPTVERKTKKRKHGKAATASSSNVTEQPQQNQGFQSYAGLKNNPPTMAPPSAISLKTNSVVPGSAFNFGPTPPGYSNFLEELRQTQNYYMGGGSHPRPPDSSEGQSGAATSQPPPAYPFLTGHQPRPNYPLGRPFIPPPTQPQLVDSNASLYQQYLQTSLLNQGLLGSQGAYPPGYHAALSMRQPYDSMTRPPWL